MSQSMDLDFTGVTTSNLIPEGTHVVRISAADFSKAQTGSDQLEVEFENVNGVMHRHAFSLEGEVISWQNVVSCWSIKNAPSWIWEHFEKPKVTEPFEKWVLVNITGVIQRQFDTSEDMEIYVDRHSTAYRKAKITGEIEYEVEE